MILETYELREEHAGATVNIIPESILDPYSPYNDVLLVRNQTVPNTYPDSGVLYGWAFVKQGHLFCMYKYDKVEFNGR